MSRLNGSRVTSEVDYHAQPNVRIETPELVPFSPTCDAGNCERETAYIVKTVERPLPGWRDGGVTTFWLAVCREHAKEEMDYASDMLGNLYFMIVRTGKELR